MKLLLDTHAFLWWDGARDRLSQQALTLCLDPSNLLLVSVASLWEIQIKMQIGRLSLRLALADIVADQRRANGIEVLPVTLPHVLALESLPLHHKDPFDRLLIAQASVEEAVLLGADAAFAKYLIRTIW